MDRLSAPPLSDPAGLVIDLHAVLWTSSGGFASPVITPALHTTGLFGYTSAFSLDGCKYASTYHAVSSGHTGSEKFWFAILIKELENLATIFI